MTRIRPGQPGHGGSACLRLRPVRIVDGRTEGGWTGSWEIICPDCGDDIGLDYRTVSPFLQRVRGPYRSEADGLAALRLHRGAATRPVPLPAQPVPPPQPARPAQPAGQPVGPAQSAVGERL